MFVVAIPKLVINCTNSMQEAPQGMELNRREVCQLLAGWPGRTRPPDKSTTR